MNRATIPQRADCGPRRRRLDAGFAGSPLWRLATEHRSPTKDGRRPRGGPCWSRRGYRPHDHSLAPGGRSRYCGRGAESWYRPPDGLTVARFTVGEVHAEHVGPQGSPISRDAAPLPPESRQLKVLAALLKRPTRPSTAKRRAAGDTLRRSFWGITRTPRASLRRGWIRARSALRKSRGFVTTGQAISLPCNCDRGA
jgi:hypothetical protein